MVGSINTTLTLALAREWRPGAAKTKPGPVLLVTGGDVGGGGAVALDQPGGGADSAVPDLLDVYPERMFRFCLNNPRLATLVIDFSWASRQGETPSSCSWWWIG